MKAPDLVAMISLVLAIPVQAATLAAMKGDHRVVVVAAPAAGDPRLARQRRALGGWQGATDRDVRTVELVGTTIRGTDDDPASLRRRLALPLASFAVILIGRDGNVALRSAVPLSARRLESAIDAMPMRRAGGR